MALVGDKEQSVADLATAVDLSMHVGARRGGVAGRGGGFASTDVVDMVSSSSTDFRCSLGGDLRIVGELGSGTKRWSARPVNLAFLTIFCRGAQRNSWLARA